MSELTTEVFDLANSNLPVKCAGGLALKECVYTQEMIGIAADFTPDRVLRGHNRGRHPQSLYPPKVQAEEGLPKINQKCALCGQLCVVHFEMDGDHVREGSKVEVEYKGDEENHVLRSVTGLRLTMLDEEGKIFPPPESRTD